MCPRKKISLDSLVSDATLGAMVKILLALVSISISLPCFGDTPQGIKEIHLQAEQGNAVAQRNLGFAYLKGIGVTKNETEAFKWVLKAAE